MFDQKESKIQNTLPLVPVFANEFTCRIDGEVFTKETTWLCDNLCNNHFKEIWKNEISNQHN